MEDGNRSSRIGGAIFLMLLGAFFLLQQIMPNNLNWWALFIMLPGIILLVEWFSQRNEQINKLVIGVGFMLVGLIFMFSRQINILRDISWSVIWPVLLIIGGVALLLRSNERKSRRQ
jgi:membrane-bound ClpP family serine protease